MPEDALSVCHFTVAVTEVYERQLAAQSAQQNGRQMISGRELGELLNAHTWMRCGRLSVACTH